ncbi:restriction endonuclease [Clavibacter sp. VKM Ac-2873]|uniref:BsuBI/PstI family type II restriction endonuclease n=1 Tax=Clavibacter sp. VKM Ac-2873 TaxID=2783813 RepID=UPI00188D99B7|nr:BsuBI/PstI family type II restriction endonuclease [Clavibacter sp. VKM Ac-2873]MBF4618034.1 restriction endonuclease [Clavibacter sp. VKM Ac-2873]
MNVFLPTVSVDVAAQRLGLIFPILSFDTTLSNALAAHALRALIYVGAVHDSDGDAEQAFMRPSMALWLSDDAASHVTEEERRSWHAAASRSAVAVARLEAEWGITFRPGYAENTRESLRETLDGWLEYGALLQRSGIANNYPGPRWQLTREFAALFDPSLSGNNLAAAIGSWVLDHMSALGRYRSQAVRQLAQEAHAVDVVLPGGRHRQLTPGDASRILKGVVEDWAPRKLHTPRVLTISEPGDQIFVADAKTLSQIGMEIDQSSLLPDCLIVDIGASPVELWLIEAVATDGVITERRKSEFISWAASQGIPSASCRFMTAFVSRNSPIAKRRLKDLASETTAWFLNEPEHELKWSIIDRTGYVPVLAVVTPIDG